MNNLTINGTQEFMGIEIPVIEGGFGEGKRCVSDKTISEIHGQANFKIRERISTNINRLKEGVDYIDLQRILEKDTLLEMGYSKQSISQADSIYLLSERGYSKLIKIMDTDQSWEIYDSLLDEYFSMREEMVKMSEYIAILEANQKLIESNNKLMIQSDYHKKDAEQQKRHIEDLTAKRNDFNISCDIPIRELKKDVRAFMDDFTEEKTDCMTRRGSLYDSYVYSRRRRGVHPNIAQFEQIVVDLGYSFNGILWLDLQLNKDIIR